MPHTALTLTEWLAKASPPQRDKLAKLSGSHPRHLYQIATGRRNATAAKAAEIETASKAIEGLPSVLRTTVCQACASCPFAKRCIDAATASEAT